MCVAFAEQNYIRYRTYVQNIAIAKKKGGAGRGRKVEPSCPIIREEWFKNLMVTSI